MNFLAYSTLQMVKERLGIPETNTEYDQVLENKIEAADSLIDNRLKRYTKVPLENPPKIIAEISADLAAALFREDQAPPGEPNVFRERAEKALERYIQETYLHIGFTKTD